MFLWSALRWFSAKCSMSVLKCVLQIKRCNRWVLSLRCCHNRSLSSSSYGGPSDVCRVSFCQTQLRGTRLREQRTPSAHSGIDSSLRTTRGVSRSPAGLQSQEPQGEGSEFTIERNHNESPCDGLDAHRICSDGIRPDGYRCLAGT